MAATIRVATIADLDAILELRKQATLAVAPNAEAGITRDDVLRRDWTSEERRQKYITRISAHPEREHVWVADDGGVVVGVIFAERGEAHSSIGRLFVAKSHQGRMLGRKLAREALRWVGSEKDVIITVVRWNPIRRLYLRVGFVEIGTEESRTSAPGKVVPQIVMKRPGSGTAR